MFRTINMVVKKVDVQVCQNGVKKVDVHVDRDG